MKLLDKFFILLLVVFVVSSIVALADAVDFPKVINPNTGFPHHWIIGVIAALVTLTLLAGSFMGILVISTKKRRKK